MKKYLAIFSALFAFLLIFLTSCSSSNTVYTSVLNDENVKTYATKGISSYIKGHSSIESVESYSYAALYQNDNLSDAIYYELSVVITVNETTTTTTDEAVYDAVIYFAYFPSSSNVYPMVMESDGEYKTAYNNAVNALSNKTYNGKAETNLEYTTTK